MGTAGRNLQKERPRLKWRPVNRSCVMHAPDPALHELHSHAGRILYKEKPYIRDRALDRRDFHPERDQFLPHLICITAVKADGKQLLPLHLLHRLALCQLIDQLVELPHSFHHRILYRLHQHAADLPRNILNAGVP